jgi:hypothetical protein
MSDVWNQPNDPRVKNLEQDGSVPQLLRWRISQTGDEPADRPWTFESEWNVDGETQSLMAYWLTDELLESQGVWRSIMDILKPNSTQTLGGFVPFQLQVAPPT